MSLKIASIRPEGKKRQVLLFHFGQDEFISIPLFEGESKRDILKKICMAFKVERT